MFKLSELEPGMRDYVETYQMTQAEEEGRFISFSRATREYKSGLPRGIYEYRGEPRPNGSNNHSQNHDFAMARTLVFGTK